LVGLSDRVADATIRRGNVADAAELATFAARTFEETYAADNDPVAFCKKEKFADVGRTFYMVGPDKQVDRVLVASAQPRDSEAS